MRLLGGADVSKHRLLPAPLRAVALALALACGATASVETAPRAGIVDPRVRTVAIWQNDVVAIEGRYGFLTMIELSEDERIENVAIEDSLAWRPSAARACFSSNPSKPTRRPISRSSPTDAPLPPRRRRK